MAETRNEAVTHEAVTQGGDPGAVAGKVQPTMPKGKGWVTTGLPITVTRGAGAVGSALPAWAQSAVVVASMR
jgi:hypothetical protein